MEYFKEISWHLIEIPLSSSGDEIRVRTVTNSALRVYFMHFVQTTHRNDTVCDFSFCSLLLVLRPMQYYL